MLTAGRARGRAHGDPHRWRRRWHVWIRSHMQPIAPRCGCDSGVGYDLRKWRVVDAIDFGPWRNAGESVPAAAHSLRDFQRDIVRWRAGSLLTLGFSTALCGMVQVHRRPTCGGRVNPGYGDPDRRTSVVQLRAMARRRGQLADLGYPVTPVLARKLAQVMGSWRMSWARFSTIEKRRSD